MDVQACGVASMALQKYDHCWHFLYERMQNICIR